MADEKQPEQPGGESKPAGSGPDQVPKPAAKPVPPKVVKKPPVMETTPWEDELTADLAEQFGAGISQFAIYLGQKFLVATASAVPPILEHLKFEAGFDYLVDITAVDYPKDELRFELVYVLYSFARNERIRIKTRVADGEKAESVVGVHLTANWLEREVYDMFGVEFANHPDLKRILMPDEWEGFPLRKDQDIVAMDNQWVKNNLGIDSGQ